ncbi:hypothetical protein OG689_35795 [Kitasatospora sp. NBC_00240]|uniref:hypothetical protein n=1 Tax=Kitasatospora sp. NBC_00240 TaxID=2903567 RepID=UPI0022535D7A|nr:hypothetical protein [Kitasatospora sp. NBC_00240]MCX5214563.1 hypothetical protein [Kitasatospora sp. NBC_00240]
MTEREESEPPAESAAPGSPPEPDASSTGSRVARFFGADRRTSAWRERTLVRARYLAVQLDRERLRQPEDPVRKALIAGMATLLAEAQAGARERCLASPGSGASLERASANLRAAELILLELVADEELGSWVAEVQECAESSLRKADPHRIALAAAIKKQNGQGGAIPDRRLLIGTLSSAYTELGKEYTRVRSLRNILIAATVVVFLGAAGLALFGWFAPQTLSLCFEPKDTTTTIVCPSIQRDATETVTVETLANRKDALLVEVAGAAGATLTVVASLPRIQGTSTPYMLPLAAALLKVPTGALSAFLGVLLIRGEFIPGLSNLDSSGQVLAWGVVFGASQHLVTRFVDTRAQETLTNTGKPTAGTSADKKE